MQNRLKHWTEPVNVTQLVRLSSQQETIVSTPIDYYFAPQSPWTYLGHARFTQIARAAGATVCLLPTDLGKVFPVSGGLPLGQRAPQRQAYRLVELQRHADYLGVPIHINPRYFPVAGDDAARLIIAVDQQDGLDAAMQLGGAICNAVWAQERNIADAAVLAELLGECGLSDQRLAQSRSSGARTGLILSSANSN